MRAMKNSGIAWIGEIPEDWLVKPVKSAFYRKKEKARQSNPVILSLARSSVKIRDIESNEGQLAESYFDYNPVSIGDLLINPMDLYSGANCNMSEVEGVISPAYINLQVTKGHDPKYYDYYFKTQYWSMAFFAHGFGVSYENRWTLSNETLKNYKIPVPKYEEQIHLREYLDIKIAYIDNIIEKTKESIEEYKKFKQAFITETVTKGLNPDVKMKNSGIEWIGDIPEHWAVNSLRYLGNLQNGVSKGGEFFGTGLPFVSYSDVYKNYELPKVVEGLFESTEKDRENYSVEAGDVLFTRTSETIEEIGYAAICMRTIENSVFGGFLIRFRPYRKNELDTLYSKFYFRSEIHRRFFVKEMNIVTRASLSQELLKKLPVILPPKNEQVSIGIYLEEKCNFLDRQLIQKENLISELESYKKSLIYEVVTGKKEIM